MAGDRRSTESNASDGLLGGTDPPPVDVVNPLAPSPFLIIGDHAGNRIPAALGALGLAHEDRTRHIAWDIGVAALGKALAAYLDAVFVQQCYSRLVIDCNRDPTSPDAMPVTSDGTVVPSNHGLDAASRMARVLAIHAPYQQAIAQEINRRRREKLPIILISLHSFTPAMAGVYRPWDIGVLHDGGNDRFALRLLRELQGSGTLVVGDNEPYRMDETDHTVPRHAFPSLPYAELEISQRHLLNDDDIASWCQRLAASLAEAARR